MAVFDPTRRAVQRAASLRRAGDAPGAIDALALVLTKDEDHVAANAELARALTALGDPAGAEEAYRRAIVVVLD
jgi:Tfp pilus assembly protein PilF